MKISNNILVELKEIAPAVANIGNDNPYSVPMGYFEKFPGKLMSMIEREKINYIDNLYHVPDGYFDGLANNILSKVKSINEAPNASNEEVFEELEHVAPLLNTINKRNVLSVPENYFFDLKVDTGIIRESKTAKVISIANNARKWFTYAAAASVLFFLSTTSYLYINHHMKNVDRSLTIGQRLATLDDKEIINYLDNDIDDFDLNTTSPAEDSDINHLLINASDEEIQNYLDASSSENVDEAVKGI